MENGLRDAILVIVIVLPIKYLFNSSLRIILIFESRRVLSPAFSTTLSIIRTICPLFADYSRTIRTIRTIRRLFALFASQFTEEGQDCKTQPRHNPGTGILWERD